MEALKTCSFCGNNAFSHFEDADHAHHVLRYWICKNCGLVFQSPRPTEDDIRAFYQEGYRSLYQESEQPTKKDLVMQMTRASLNVDMIRPEISSIHRHLDVGSSSGAFLQAVREQYGCEMIGVEPGEGYRAFSLDQGVASYSSLEELRKQGENPFDFVSLLHVLEHLSNPLQTLIDLREDLMSTGGYLMIEVPNLFEHESFELAHLYAFSSRTLGNLVEEAGFEVLWLKAHGGFRSPILKLYLTLLARIPPILHNARRKPVRPRLIRFQRKYGALKRRLFTKLLPDWTWQSPSVLWDEP